MDELERTHGRHYTTHHFKRRAQLAEILRNADPRERKTLVSTFFDRRGGTRKITATAPQCLKLTTAEWQLVTHAYENGLQQKQELRDLAAEVPIAIEEIRRFLKIWHQMSPIAKWCLADEDDVRHLHQGSTDPLSIERRAELALRTLITPQGRPGAIANVGAAEVLADLWRSRGGKTNPGRLYSDKKSGGGSGSDYNPNPFVKFVAIALRCLDATLKTDRMAARRAKSAVDALKRERRIFDGRKGRWSRLRDPGHPKGGRLRLIETL
jgi:hypothetical protein